MMSIEQGNPSAEGDGTTEDAVRRMLESETGGGPAIRPAARNSGVPVAASGEAVAAPGIVSRMAETPKRMASEGWETAKTAVMSYRPEPRHMALLLLVIIVLTMPWLIPTLILLAVLIVLISHLTLGPDRFGEVVAAWYGWLARRNPDGAEVLRARAQVVSAKLSNWAEYLPERWTNGLYLPDFSEPDESQEKLADDPFERLVADPQNQ